MPQVKILQEYDNAEGWQKGEVVEVTNPWTLIDQGLAVLVDEQGNEMERPGLLHCPICSFNAKTALALAEHIIDSHPKKATQPAAVRAQGKKVQKKEEGLPPEEAAQKVDEIMTSTTASPVQSVTYTTDPTPEEVEARKDMLRRQRILNLEKARKVRAANLAAKKAGDGKVAAKVAEKAAEARKAKSA